MTLFKQGAFYNNNHVFLWSLSDKQVGRQVAKLESPVNKQADLYPLPLVSRYFTGNMNTEFKVFILVPSFNSWDDTHVAFCDDLSTLQHLSSYLFCLPASSICNCGTSSSLASEENDLNDLVMRRMILTFSRAEIISQIFQQLIIASQLIRI